MKINKSIALQIAFVLATAGTIGWKLQLGNQKNGSGGFHFDQVFTPNASVAQQKPRSPDNTGADIENAVKLMLYTP